MFGALRRILSAAASSSGCSGIGTQQFGAPLRTLKFFQHDASAAAQQLFGIRFQANSASAGQQTRQLAQVVGIPFPFSRSVIRDLLQVQ